MTIDYEALRERHRLQQPCVRLTDEELAALVECEDCALRHLRFLARLELRDRAS